MDRIASARPSRSRAVEGGVQTRMLTRGLGPKAPPRPATPAPCVHPLKMREGWHGPPTRFCQRAACLSHPLLRQSAGKVTLSDPAEGMVRATALALNEASNQITVQTEKGQRLMLFPPPESLVRLLVGTPCLLQVAQ
jgi:hypothetical protein